MQSQNPIPINVMTDTSDILTMTKLTKAIKNSVGNRGINHEEAKRMAEHMLNFFGYSDRIIDNVLEPEDRDVFYMMEDSGILTTEREETTLFDGREWRINYWLFRRDKVYELLNSKADDEEGTGEQITVYDDIPEDIWVRE